MIRVLSMSASTSSGLIAATPDARIAALIGTGSLPARFRTPAEPASIRLSAKLRRSSELRRSITTPTRQAQLPDWRSDRDGALQQQRLAAMTGRTVEPPTLATRSSTSATGWLTSSSTRIFSRICGTAVSIFAGGYEHREINQKQIPDPVQASNDQLGFNQAPPLKFRQEVDSCSSNSAFRS